MQIDSRHIKAHRGASGQFPENTLRAFRKAHQAGVRDIHEAGYPVRVYTGNDETDMARMIEANVDIIMSDYPERWL